MNVNNVSGVRSDISAMLERIRDVSSKHSVFNTEHTIDKTNDFQGVMNATKNVLNNVNSTQAEAETMKEKYLKGESDVTLTQVMVSSEKSKLAFEGLIIVRNKCLEAYKEIMNMPV